MRCSGRTCVTCGTPIRWQPAECMDCRWPGEKVFRRATAADRKPDRKWSRQPKPKPKTRAEIALGRRMAALARKPPRTVYARAVLPPAEAGSARAMWQSGMSLAETGKHFGISRTKAWRIARQGERQ